MNTKQREIQIKKTISDSWVLLKANWKFLVKCFLVVIGIQIGLSAISNILEGISKNGNVGSQVLFGFWSFGFVIISIYVSCIIDIGLTRTLLSVVRSGKNLSWKTVFPRLTIGYLIRYFIVSLLYGLLVLFGLVLFIIPGIYFAIKYCYCEILFIDKEIGIKEAFILSGKMTQGIKWQLILFGLAIFGLNILGVLALGVGLIVTIPLSALANSLLYTHLLSRLPKKD